MRYVITGLLLLLAMILFFMFITACAPARTMTRDGYRGTRTDTRTDKAEESDFYYGEDDRVSGDEVAAAPRRERSRKQVAPTLRSGSGEDAAGDDLAGDDVETSDGDAGRSEKFFQKGEASWYGRAFHGKLTASGERFNMNELTAAHRTLPFGTLLEVKNLDNDRTVKVRVNDRGPYRGARILDLSYAAARRLDMLGAGTTNVGLIVLGKGQNDRASRKASEDEIEGVGGVDDESRVSDDESPRGSGRLSLQAGAFFSRNNAERLKSRIEGMTRNPVTIIRDGDLYKIRINALSSRKEAGRLRNRLHDEDIPAFVVDDGRE